MPQRQFTGMPAALRIVTWNINSARLRLPLLLRLLQEWRPDVLCLQEIKCLTDVFPRKALAAAGYPYQHVWGIKSYNGVAIIARAPLTDGAVYPRVGREDARHISARLPSGVVVHNIYVPAGGDIPDPVANDKFAHKLDFVRELADYFALASQRRLPLVIAGDLNIAPQEHDVWSHRQLREVVSHTPLEVDLLNGWRQAGDFTDSARHFVPASEKLYSWWSYRAADWAASDRGRRLDHLWVGAALRPQLQQSITLRSARGWEQPSDHVPVAVDLAID